MSDDGDFYETLANLGVTVEYDWCICGQRACDQGLHLCHICLAERPNP